MTSFLRVLLLALPLVVQPMMGFTAPSVQQRAPVMKDKRQILVNNRVLATVNGQPISVLDVMKKMDMIFYKQFPQYAESSEMRYQFYTTNWRSLLQDMIDKELILADASERQMEVTKGEVRQELEQMFGPHVMVTLNRVGLTYDEAWKIVHSDMVIKRMLFAKTNIPAMTQVGPKQVITAYEKFLEQNQDEDEWYYQVLSIRDDDTTLGAKVSEAANQMLTSKEASFDDIVEKILARDDLAHPKTIKVSEEYHHTDKKISLAYLETLQQLEKGSYSQPIAQASRSSKSTVHRVFFLKDVIHHTAPTFEVMENKIYNQIFDKKIGKETDDYMTFLHEHYHIDDEVLNLQPDFQPFVLF